MHIGLLEIHPFVSFEEKYDDNIYLEPANEKNIDWISVISMGVELLKPIVPKREDDLILKINYKCDIIEFSDKRKESRIDHDAEAMVSFKFANKTMLKIDESYRNTSDPATSELTDKQERFRNKAGIVIGLGGEKMNFDFGYRNIRDGYKNLNNFDKFEHILSSTGYYKIFSKTSILSEYNYGIIDYDQYTDRNESNDESEENSNINSDSGYHQLLIGVRGKIAPKVTGILKGGYRHGTYDDESKTNFRSCAVFSNLIYSFHKRGRIIITGERKPVESTYTNNSYFVSNRGGLKFDLQFAGRFFFLLEGFYQFNKYPKETTEETSDDSETAKRKDTIWNAHGSLRYEVNDVLTLKMGYYYKYRNSIFPTYDYIANRCNVMILFTF